MPHRGSTKKRALMTANWRGQPMPRGTTVPCSFCKPLTSRVARLHRATLNFGQKARFLPHSSSLFHSTSFLYLSLLCDSPSLSIPAQSSILTSRILSISCQILQPFHPHSLYPTNSSPFHLKVLQSQISFSLSKTPTSIVEVQGCRERN